MDAEHVERERKYRLRDDQRQRITESLRAAGASEVIEPLENTLYDHPVLRLRARGELVRVRRRGPHWSLTFKGPPASRESDKVRTEVELEVGAGDPRNFLEALGFQSVGGYRNDRLTFCLPGVRVSLDRINGQQFCEIEAASEVADLGTVALRLGLADAQLEPRSYAEIFGET